MAGIPIILNLYLSPLRYSVHCFIAVNAEPKELDSIDVCFLDIQYTGALFMKTRNHVLDLLVIVSTA